MNSFESAVARILVPVSELLRRPLSLVDAQSPEVRNGFAVRLDMPRVAVVAGDNAPFNDTERRLIEELFGVVRVAQETEARYEELEQRMLGLQRENLDLVVRNRMRSEERRV